MFSHEFIDMLKDRADIVEVIGDYVQLVKQGKNYRGLCPFHREKTPSFYVHQEEGYYKCFGCGAAGDVIRFLENIEGLDFQQAVENLASRLHIPLQEEQLEMKQRPAEDDRYLEICRESAFFFMENLAKSPEALQYLQKRGINMDSVRHFGIGYASDSWDALLTHLRSKGYSDTSIESTHLALRSERSGQLYDAFRHRLIFPLIDLRGRVLGFGGRAMGDALPKYYNSKESPYFTKGNMLYGLHLVRKNADRSKILLVEGNIDVVKLHQYGINYAVAALGTSFTDRQSQLLRRFGNEIYLCLDGDEAGQKATVKVMEILQSQGARPKIVQIENGMDPDEFLEAYGVDAFQRLLYDAVSVFDFYDTYAKRGLCLDRHDDFIQFLDRMRNFIAKVHSGIEREVWMKSLSDQYGIDLGTIRREVEASRPADTDQTPTPEVITVPKADNIRVMHLFRMMLTDKAIASEVLRQDLREDFPKGIHRVIYDVLAQFVEKEGKINEEALHVALQEREIPEGYIAQLKPLELGAVEWQQALQDIVKGIKEEKVIREIRGYTDAFHAALRAGDETRAADMLRKLDAMKNKKGDMR